MTVPMDVLQRILAWYLGLRAPRPGEGTSWRFGYQWPAPLWVLWVTAAIAVVFIVGLYRRDGRLLNRGQRGLLSGLRLAVFFLIASLLFELSLTIERTGLPIVALLIDTSASMSLQDQYPAESKTARWIATSGQSKNAETDRLGLTQRMLLRNEGKFVRDLEQRHQLRIYRFSETAYPLDWGRSNDETSLESSPPFDLDQLTLAIQGLRADGDQTRPAVAAKKVLGDLRGTPPAAIVFLTDGIASESENDKLSTIAETARRKGVQLHIVGLGNNSASHDLSLFDTQVDEVAFVGDPILFQSKLRSFGFAGKLVTLQLRKEGENGVLAKQQVTAPADGQTIPVELSYASLIAGEFDFVLEVVEQSEETNRTNNSETRHVSVREEKIRVLLADQRPRYEFRFLKQLLERDKSIELSTLLQESDIEYTQEDRTAISHFPVKKEELAKFDVLILGDLSLPKLGNSVLDNIRDFIIEKGGSVVFIAGTEHNPQTFAGTPLENLLPFETASVKMPGNTTSESYHPALTLEGQKGNTLFRLGNSESDSLKIWNGLPNFQWLVELNKLKPGARVFLEHPNRMGSQVRLPVILMQQVSAGKVLYHATDETWRWRFRTGDLYYGRYWIQTIRYLSRGRLIGKDRTAELTADQRIYQRGEPVTLRVKFLDEKFIPPDSDGVSVIVEQKNQGRQTLKLSRLRELPTAFEGVLNQLGEGTFHSWVSQPAFKEAPPAVDFRVENPQRELLRRGMDQSDLQNAAKTSNGRFYTLDDAERLPAEIPRGTPISLDTDQPIPLWNRWELLSLITLLLTAEWLLRKRWKLV